MSTPRNALVALCLPLIILVGCAQPTPPAADISNQVATAVAATVAAREKAVARTTVAPTDTATPAVTAPDVCEIYRMYRAKALTEAQRMAYLDTLVGAQVTGWSGTVKEVRDSRSELNMPGEKLNYTVDLDAGNLLDGTQCPEVSVQKVEKEQALNLAAGQKCQVEGVIARFWTNKEISFAEPDYLAVYVTPTTLDCQ